MSRRDAFEVLGQALTEVGGPAARHEVADLLVDRVVCGQASMFNEQACAAAIRLQGPSARPVQLAGVSRSVQL